jgi:hypothetical protein
VNIIFSRPVQGYATVSLGLPDEAAQSAGTVAVTVNIGPGTELNISFVVTALRAGGSQGSQILDLIDDNTVAVLHTHPSAEVQYPDGADHSPIKFYEAQSYVYAAQAHQLFELYRQGGEYFYGTVESDGTVVGVKHFPGK